MNSPTAKFAPPGADEYHEYYAKYIQSFGAADFLPLFETQDSELLELLGGLEPGEDSKLHEPYTWTLKQLVGHLIDCERIFSMRMLRIAVGDETPIPGIDQNFYVDNLDYENVSMADLLDEFSHLRKANVLLAKRLPPGSLDRRGIASDNPVSARANLYILVGHVAYHVMIIKRRLGLS
jgi:hypothetical protein